MAPGVRSATKNWRRSSRAFRYRPRTGEVNDEPQRHSSSTAARSAGRGHRAAIVLVQNPFCGPGKGTDGCPCARIRQAHDKSSSDPGGQRMVPHVVKMASEIATDIRY